MSKQIEYPVGSRFQVNGQWYEVKRCIGDIVCTDCSFNSKNTRICECGKPDYIPDCIGPFRKDNTNVYYVEIDPPTDFLDVTPLTRAIGSFFYDHGVKLQVCDACTDGFVMRCGGNCHYAKISVKCSRHMAIHGLCTEVRADHKSVYFKEVTDEEK